MAVDNNPLFLTYVASHNDAGSDPLHVFCWDGSAGRLEFIGTHADGLSKPLHLEADSEHQFLYATDFLNACDHGPGGAVCAFAIDRATGALSFLNRQPAGDDAPCYLSVSGNRMFLLLANYLTGTIKVYPIAANGHLDPFVTTCQQEGSGINQERQEGPHPHSIVLGPSGRFAFSPDLGADRIYLYQFNPNDGRLTPNEPPYIPVSPGSGPRHLKFHPNEQHAYLVNELTNTILTYGYDDGTGRLTQLQTSPTLPDDFRKDNLSAEVQVHPNGRFLYSSNRGHDSIAIFSIDRENGQLSPIDRISTQGSFPRAFSLDPSGNYLLVANEYTDSIVVFHVDQDSGKLTYSGQTLNVPKPVCFKFIPFLSSTNP